MSPDAPNDAGASDRGDAPDQRAYWDANLDVGNLGREAPAVDVERERRFFLATPELRHALRQLRGDAAVSAAAEGELAGLRIADIGAGLGVASLLFAERGARPELVDLAPSRLAAAGAMLDARGFAGRYGLHAAKAEKLPFDDASLDRVFTRSVLIHTDLDAALREIRRTLKPGGLAVFVEPMARNPFANLYRRFLGPDEWKTITNYFTEERIGMVRAVFPDGFSEKRWHVLGFGAYGFQFALSSPALFGAACAVVGPIDAALMALLPPTRRWAWFSAMTARKV